MVYCRHLDQRLHLDGTSQEHGCAGAFRIILLPLLRRSMLPPYSICSSQATTILFTVLHPVALVAVFVWSTLRSRGKRHQEGAIALPPDEEGEERTHVQDEHGENVGRVWN
jgi:hypothetical protein